MPGAHFHDQQAIHNEEFFDSIDHARFPDWATTALFYAAVHVWAAYSADVHGIAEQRSHRDTADEMADDPYLTDLARRAYNALRHRSRTARYYRWQALPEIANVESESKPLYEAFKAWAIAARNT